MTKDYTIHIDKLSSHLVIPKVRENTDDKFPSVIIFFFYTLLLFVGKLRNSENCNAPDLSELFCQLIE